ncbi:hypothetical protein GCM10010387_50410 [Streptomyces inusitatus]|uniref:Uncharacterized protein n=1 Tax=Streptomyces inusitatus TaxID=68221 RepID=A0A918QII5_9ACTN|nr:hypothetical protein GCM10010387_50410 [Streptomyces inusitatus]
MFPFLGFDAMEVWNGLWRTRRSSDEAACQFGQALMEVGAAFVADPESFELVQPGEGPFHHPTDFAEP